MKVKELIEELQKQNPDANVKARDLKGFYDDVIEVKGNPASCAVWVQIIAKD